MGFLRDFKGCKCNGHIGNRTVIKHILILSYIVDYRTNVLYILVRLKKVDLLQYFIFVPQSRSGGPCRDERISFEYRMWSRNCVMK